MDILHEIRTRIEAALPGADIFVTGGGGHFSIEVTSPLFEGKRTLERKRMVYGAIADLMAGDHAPLHAVDRLETRVPGQ